MNNISSLSHSKWECKYHVVWIPKCRRKVLFGQLRKQLGEVFHDLARQKESKILEGHLQPDHVHVLISIPPKYSVAQVVGYIKGKSAINIARNFVGRRKNFTGQHFWARGYHVSTVGRDEEKIQVFIQVDHVSLKEADTELQKISDALRQKLTKRWKCLPSASLPEAYNIVTLPYKLK